VAATAWWRSAAVGLLTALALFAIVTVSGGGSQIASTGISPDSGVAPTTLGSPFAGLLQPAQGRTAPPADARRVGQAYAKLPVSFVPNAGQTDESVRYQAQGAGFSFFFTDRKVRFAFENGDRGHALEMRFVGASPDARLVAGDRGAGSVSYLTGSTRHASLPTYERLTYRGLWPGIDMVFMGRGGALKYEFHVQPGADPGAIRLAYAGAEGLSLGASGTLLVGTPLGALRDARPYSFQAVEGKRVAVDSRYALEGNSYGFALGHYNHSQPLVVDPSLVYSTLLGGTGFDVGNGIAVDSAGSAYVTGLTTGSFPTTPGAFDASSDARDAFVTKLSADGSALVYSTYLGGSGDDSGSGIALDSGGSAYVIGSTTGNFPTTAAAFDPSYNGGPNDAFVAKLNATGSALTYSTYLGGAGNDFGNGIATDAAGNAYAVAQTTSSDFPATAGAFQTGSNGDTEATVTKLDPTGSAPLYSTYLGGGGFDRGLAIDVDAAGAAYVTGETSSTGFPTTAGAFDTILGGTPDAYVTKVNVGGSGLDYSTFLGGSGFERGLGIAVDAGSAYVTGETGSTDFPATPGAFDTSLNGTSDAFVTKVNGGGSGLSYSTYLGGGGSEGFTQGIAVDAGTVYVAGQTSSADFPTTPGAFDTSYGGNTDAFVTKLGASGSAPLLYSTYLGGAAGDPAVAIAVDSAGSAYVTGQTTGAGFPTTPGAFDTSYADFGDAFVAKLAGRPATLTLSPKVATNDIGTQHCVTATVKDAAANTLAGITVRFAVAGSVNTGGSPTTDANGQAGFCYQGPQLPGTDSITAFADSDKDSSQDPGEPSDTASKVWKLPATTPRCKVIDAGVITAANGDHAILAGLAQSDGLGKVKGEQVYQDLGPAQRQTVKSIQILALTCSATPKRATIFGTAKIQGSGTHPFRIDVQDLGPPFSGKDTYRILLDTGYDSGVQKVKAGDVLIHQG
jgi:beta-propeller repeat-containing protein